MIWDQLELPFHDPLAMTPPIKMTLREILDEQIIESTATKRNYLIRVDDEVYLFEDVAVRGDGLDVEYIGHAQ